jgi:adenosine deaminase
MQNQYKTRRPLAFYKSLPKVELHRHLEGSIRLKTLMEIGRAHGIESLETGRLRPLVQIEEDEPNTFENFLSKFTTLRLFYRSPEAIHRITCEAVEDAAADNVRHLELRFTPVALSRAEGFPLNEVMDWVIEGARQGEEEFGVSTRLIASINRHESPDLGEQVAQLAVDRMNDGITGLDLAGNEAEFSAEPFIKLLDEAQKAGLHVTVHAGEWGGASNVRQAIQLLNTKRIGHGVRVLEDPSTVALARDRQITFEVCITSNYQSGVVPSIVEHPYPEMLSRGLNATINTDDPSISQIVLSDEYRVACEDLGISLGALRDRVLAAARAAFLNETEKQNLIKNLTVEFENILAGL